MTAAPTKLLALGAALAAIAASGCDGGERKAVPYKVAVFVQSDPRVPLAGAQILKAGKLLATSGPDGRVVLELGGAEGDPVDLQIRCPDAYQSPTAPVSFVLRRYAEGKVPEYGVECQPRLRKVVVAVRSEGGANLPVVYLDRPVTRTDAAGAAHFALALRPGEQFKVVLDTHENDKLKPASPAKVFVVGQADEVLVFDQPFKVDRPRPVYHGPVRRGPRHL